MGYCMQLQEASFSIKPSNEAGAFAAIKVLAGTGLTFAWVTTSNLLSAETLSAAMREWNWDLDRDGATGEIFDIHFVGEKLGDERHLFKAIAPFVEPGSYIEMQGEDGTLWRWVFDGKTCEEKSATVSWD